MWPKAKIYSGLRILFRKIFDYIISIKRLFFFFFLNIESRKQKKEEIKYNLIRMREISYFCTINKKKIII